MKRGADAPLQGPGEEVARPSASSVLPAQPEGWPCTAGCTPGVGSTNGSLALAGALGVRGAVHDAEGTSCSPVLSHTCAHTTHSHLYTPTKTCGHTQACTPHTDTCITHTSRDHTHKACLRVCLFDFKEKVRTWIPECCVLFIVSDTLCDFQTDSVSLTGKWGHS